MCQPREWKNLFTYGDKGYLIVGGLRSDDKIFRVNLPETEVNLAGVVNLIKKFEEYRSCGCGTSKICKKHPTI